MADDLKNISKGITELVKVTKTEFDKLAGKVGGEITGVMSDEMKMVSDHVKSGFDSFKKTGSQFLSFLTSGGGEGTKIAWLGLGLQKKEVKLSKEDLKLQKKQLGMQEDMHFWAKWRHKAGLISFKKIAKGGLAALMGLIGIPLMLLGTIIGAQVALIVKPFAVIWKLLKSIPLLGKLFKGVGNLFTHLKLLLLTSPKFGGFFVKLGKLFKFFSRIPLIGHLIKGLKFGFKSLFWPLQLILSLIDFVKGFMATEGSIYEKIKGGLENVVVKFLEFPAMLLGKMWEWFQVNFLGKDPASINQGQAAGNIILGIKKTFRMIFEGWELIFGLIAPYLNDLWDIIKGLDWKTLKKTLISWGDSLTGIYAGLKDFILGLFGIDPSGKPQKNTTQWEQDEIKAGRGGFAAETRQKRWESDQLKYEGKLAEAKKIDELIAEMKELNKTNREQLEQAKKTQPIYVEGKGGQQDRFLPAEIAEMKSGEND